MKIYIYISEQIELCQVVLKDGWLDRVLSTNEAGFTMWSDLQGLIEVWEK